MCARVVTVQIQPGKLDEAIQIFRDSIKPAARQQKGHQGGYLLADRQTGKVMSIALWETEADLTTGETSGYLREQMAKIAATFAAPPVSEHFEVSVS